MIRIVTDSSADITQAEAKSLGITVMPLTINFGEQSYRDGVDILTEEFYSRLATEDILPTTSQANPLQYEKIFSQAKMQGDTIILLPISRKISGSHNCAMLAKQQGHYDNVYIVDTLCTVSYLRILVLEALAKKDTMPAQQLVEHLEQLRKRIKLYSVVDTLDYLHRGGRVSKTAATVGTMLSIKPIISIVEGEIKVVAKAIGVKNGITWLTKKLHNAKLDSNYPVIFGYAGTKTRAIELIDKAIEDEQQRNIYKNRLINVSAIVGVHTGPNLAVVTYVEQ